MRVVVLGAGIVGSCTALALAKTGCAVVVLDRTQVGGGTTSRGEGNVLVSDKPPGPELELAVASRRRWAELGEELGRDAIELEDKGGLVVATTPAALGPLGELARAQGGGGVVVERVEDPRSREPLLAEDLAGAVWYPQDAQVQPTLAAVALLEAAVRLGAVYRPFTEVVAAVRSAAGELEGVRTSTGEHVAADVVVNCAGPWGAQAAERLGAPVPVLPRKGFVLVTEPLPSSVRSKVYSADYVANVAASSEGLETSCVVESTRGGTVLVGASRERVGFDASMSAPTVARLAAQAVRLFPFLADVRLIRVYRGFRPYCPDHLPVIGPDPRVPGVLHACGHEGAGIGLAPATADLVAAYVTGADAGAATGTDPAPFLPDRLVEVDTRPGEVSWPGRR